ncbi:MAG: DnaJ domain-containing protein [Candidatus Coatesbacteria bacterium]|nr:DnaJ domain-containing protein [Candidatus Coatesbacteria bacterium]
MANLYEILGVKENASPQEIKQAYFKAIRKFPPEKFPEEFRKVRQSYEILKNTQTRQQYDHLNNYGPELKRRLTSGLTLLENQDFSRAITEFQSLLNEYPDATFIRHYLGLSFLYNQMYLESMMEYETLTGIDPSNRVFWQNLGRSQLGIGQSEAAIDSFEKAYQIDPTEAGIVLDYIEILVDGENYSRAEEILISRIRELNEGDFEMFVYLFPLVRLYGLQDSQDKVEATIAKIRENIPSDQETKNYVGLKLAQLAQLLFKTKLFHLAKQISLEAKEISPNNPLIQDLYEDAFERDSLERDLKHLYEDKDIPAQVKDLCHFFYDKSTTGENRDNWQNKVLEELKDVPKEHLLNAIYKIKTDYKHIYETNEDFFEYYISAELGGDSEQIKSVKDYCKKCGNNATESYLASHGGYCPVCFREEKGKS